MYIIGLHIVSTALMGVSLRYILDTLVQKLIIVTARRLHHAYPLSQRPITCYHWCKSVFVKGQKTRKERYKGVLKFLLVLELR